jgi:hypothetical protein
MMHVMHVMHVMMVVMMMVVMMVHWRGHRSGRRSSGFLRDGISGEAKRENGRGRKSLDHGRTFPVVYGTQKGSQRPIEAAA